MVNEQLLVALPGLLALAFALALPRCSREGVSPVDRTLLRVLVVGACVSLVMWAFVNPALGNLDWDLLSMPAPAIVMAGLYFLNLRLRERSGLSHIRVALVSLSLFHTIPWIVLQQYPDRAVAALESMVERDVHNFSRGNLGIGMFMEGHREEGRRQLERTRELGVSDKPVVLRWLSRIYIEEERYGAAEQLLARTLGIIPDKRTIELVRLYRERAPRGKERTIGLLENVISVFPHPTYFGLLTEFYRAEGRDQDLERLTRHLDETIAQLERQIPERPRDGELYLRLGALYLRRGRVRSAESALERAEMLELSRLHRISVSSLQRVIAELRSGQDLVDGAIGGSDLRGDQLR